MSIADSIISAMNQKETDDLIIIQKKLKSKKKLSQQDFKLLVSLLQERAIEVISIPDLSLNEYNLISKGLLAAKIKNFEEVLKFVINSGNKKSAVIVHSLLSKSCKLDCSILENYIKRMLSHETHLIHLKILLVISKNYSNHTIMQEILHFCEGHDHPICKELLKRHRIEAE